MVLLGVILQKGVLVSVQVVHQVTVATVLGHQVQRAWWVKDERVIFGDLNQNGFNLMKYCSYAEQTDITNRAENN